MNQQQKIPRKKKIIAKARPKQSPREPVIAARGSVKTLNLPTRAVFKHRELVGTVAAAATASWQLLGHSGYTPGYDINPANEVVFSWLATQAPCWEKYKFSKLKFELVPGNPSTSPGRVYAMVEYDYDDPIPTSLKTMGAAYGLKTSDIWKPFSLEVNCPQMNSGMATRYVSSASRINGVEPRTVFGGYIVFAAAGCTAGATWDIFVDYEVELMIPQMPSFQAESAFVTMPAHLDAIPPGNYFPIDLDLSGTIRTVMSGVKGIPEVRAGLYATTTWLGKRIIDVSDYADGRLEASVTLDDCIETPAITAPDAGLEGFAFDQLGTYLGPLSTLAGAIGFPLAAATPTTWGSAATPIKTSAAISMATLFTLWPMVRYIALGLFNGSAKPSEIANLMSGTARIFKHEL
jgi:hypothetical protein